MTTLEQFMAGMGGKRVIVTVLPESLNGMAAALRCPSCSALLMRVTSDAATMKHKCGNRRCAAYGVEVAFYVGKG